MFTDPTARRYLQRNEWLRRQLDDFFWKPRGATVDSSQDSLTIEDMLTILHDWARVRYPTPEEHPESIRRFSRFLKVLIYQALYEGKSSRAGHLNPLIDFARRSFEHTTWASFNWDCLFESSFWYSSGEPGVPGARRNPVVAVKLRDWLGTDSHHTLLKLHGGINWWMRDGHLTYLRFTSGGELSRAWAEYEERDLGETYPAILEPSYYKYDDDVVYKILAPQWDLFLERLREADYVLFIGYSLPESDSRARSTITTAFQMNDGARWALIDPTAPVCDRYGRLLGRKRFKSFPRGLVGFNTALEDNMKEAFAGLTVSA